MTVFACNFKRKVLSLNICVCTGLRIKILYALKPLVHISFSPSILTNWISAQYAWIQSNWLNSVTFKNICKNRKLRHFCILSLLLFSILLCDVDPGKWRLIVPFFDESLSFLLCLGFLNFSFRIIFFSLFLHPVQFINCSKRVRTYCSCDPGYWLFNSCFLDHFQRFIVGDLKTDWIQSVYFLWKWVFSEQL